MRVRKWPKIAAGKKVFSVCFGEISLFWKEKFLNFAGQQWGAVQITFIVK